MAPHRYKATMDYLARHHATVVLRRFPVGAPHMNAVEETWRRSKLDTLACEYHGSLDDMKKKLAEYFRTTREIMRNLSKPYADKFRSDTITPHVKCQIHLIRPYAGCNRRTKN